MSDDRILADHVEAMRKFAADPHGDIFDAPADVMRTTCLWRADEDGIWSTVCGNEFVFIDGDPQDNHFSFCPYCGLALTVQRYVEVSYETRDGDEDAGQPEAARDEQAG